jgi:hypothetical protein
VILNNKKLGNARVSLRIISRTCCRNKTKENLASAAMTWVRGNCLQEPSAFSGDALEKVRRNRICIKFASIAFRASKLVEVTNMRRCQVESLVAFNQRG